MITKQRLIRLPSKGWESAVDNNEIVERVKEALGRVIPFVVQSTLRNMVMHQVNPVRVLQPGKDQYRLVHIATGYTSTETAHRCQVIVQSDVTISGSVPSLVMYTWVKEEGYPVRVTKLEVNWWDGQMGTLEVEDDLLPPSEIASDDQLRALIT